LETLLTSGCTWIDFLSFRNNKIARIDEHVLVHSDRSNNNVDCIDQLDFFLSIEEASFGSGSNNIARRTARLHVLAVADFRMEAIDIFNTLLTVVGRPQPKSIKST
jgi:hypothetical protein